MNSANGVDVSMDANTLRRRSGDNLGGAERFMEISPVVLFAGPRPSPKTKPFVQRRGRSVSTWLTPCREVYIGLVGEGQLLPWRAGE
jgi:hypothetical protein